MKKLITLILCLVLVASLASAGRVYKLTLVNLGNRLSSSSITVMDGTPDLRQSEGFGYLAKVIDLEDEVVYKTYFTPPNYGEFMLKLPYRYDGKEIIVETPGFNNLSIKISPFSETCNDGICQEYESYEDCPEDCPSGTKDDYCDGVADFKCDPDCTHITDDDCPVTEEQPIEPAPVERTVTPPKPAPPPPGTKKPYQQLSPKSSSDNLILPIILSLAIIVIILIIALKIRGRKRLAD